jgi:hypothetical protein
MNTSIHSRSDHVVEALEAGTGALRALELAAAEIHDESSDVQSRKAHLDGAIQLLQAAIAELRSYQDGHPRAGAAGFVLAVRRRRLRTRRPSTG